jgi:hypothetical protein
LFLVDAAPDVAIKQDLLDLALWLAKARWQRPESCLDKDSTNRDGKGCVDLALF